jgi:hypothetical protein|tara:strand:- start:248 stop:382 length:135 start_codon:yes stop_codon:yes gene_type:complete
VCKQGLKNHCILKGLKELLELDVITQEDYDKEKAILTPIILGKN